MTDVFLSIGNTRAVMCVFNENEPITAHTTADMNVLLRNTAAKRIYMISVNSQREHDTVSKIDYPCELIGMGKQDDAIKTAYRTEQMGMDRYISIYHAQRKCIFPSVIADLGTADTFDYIDSSGMHIGGLIMAGLQTMHVGISNAAENIPLLEPQLRDIMAGTDTEEAVTQGIYTQWLAGIISAVSLMGEIEETYTTVITGGNAKRVHDFLKHAQHEPYFLFRGMQSYAENIYNA